LDFDGVQLAEGPWPGEAYVDAAKREASRSVPVPLNYASSRAPIVSQGVFDQHPGESCQTNVSGGPTPAGQSPSPAPGTLPSEEAIPLPSPINGGAAAPKKPTLVQPEVIQTSASESTGKKTYPVIGAGYGEPAAAMPTIALRPGATQESTAPNAEPAAPRRLPATGQP
jgi:hypothetical protein